MLAVMILLSVTQLGTFASTVVSMRMISKNESKNRARVILKVQTPEVINQIN